MIKQFLTGGDRNLGYLVADETTRRAAVIDPSYAPETIHDFARQNNYQIEYVLNTHDHWDHTNGNDTMKKLCAKAALLFGDTDPTTGIAIADGARLPLGNLEIVIIHTPGHTHDAICFYIEDAVSNTRAVFTGDTLFVGKVGGTDLGAGARAEYESLHHKLLALPGDTRVLPGHNVGVALESTIAGERESNPFLTQPDYESFVQLKKNWAAYKKEHGID